MFTGQDLDSSSEYEDSNLETEHERRRKQLAASDPVHCIVLEEYFRNQVIREIFQKAEKMSIIWKIRIGYYLLMILGYVSAG